MKRSVVLLSGGLDSSVNFLAALQEGPILLALTFDYGQRAAGPELASARRLAEHFKVRHQVVELGFFKAWGQSSLTDHGKEIPRGSEVSIDDLQVSAKTAKSVWVPNRNGIFLNVAAGFAESLGASRIIPGFNREEAATFPDNSEAFLQASTLSLAYSTANQVRVECLTTNLDKTEIVKMGRELGMDWSWIWPCYFSGARWCGQCESCLRSKRALSANGVDVETLFES